MKNLAVLITVCITIVSCQTKNTSDNTLSNTAYKIPTSLKLILQGNWVEEPYINGIAETKSPRKSQKFFTYIQEMDIDTNATKGDTLNIGSPNVHEGGDFDVYFQPGIAGTSFSTSIKDEDNGSNFYELSYKITTKDTSLFIDCYEKSKKLLNRTKFIKVPRSTEGALQYMVNKLLFSGTYTTIDSSGISTTTIFKNDGSVTGFSDFKHYYVLTDFVTEPEDGIDEIFFDIASKNQKEFGFEIKADTIMLYHVLEMHNRDSVWLGSPAYKLIKK